MSAASEPSRRAGRQVLPIDTPFAAAALERCSNSVSGGCLDLFHGTSRHCGGAGADTITACIDGFDAEVVARGERLEWVRRARVWPPG